ncbi:hypothetical protein JTE90_028323 [Oedothorax gibbosus]|uniref:Uncharacterized protein n=1 Tax=Oedothorax gibbosus TaxID=931172 RepID=A0AAV6V532_9ARAC|nr:hypothetical protein JTE90_028323 [Oedothorax gibbosus]
MRRKQIFPLEHQPKVLMPDAKVFEYYMAECIAIDSFGNNRQKQPNCNETRNDENSGGEFDQYPDEDPYQRCNVKMEESSGYALYMRSPIERLPVQDDAVIAGNWMGIEASFIIMN